MITFFIYSHIAAHFDEKHEILAFIQASYAFEALFLIDIILKFFAEIRSSSYEQPIKDLSQIGLYYLKT